MKTSLVRKLMYGVMLMALIFSLGVEKQPAQAQTLSKNNFYNVLMQDGADPWMIKHSDGWYYFTKTTGGNITLWRSKTITGVDAGDTKVVWTPPANTSYSQNIWAPELHFLDNKWYIYFAADDGHN